MDIVWDPELTDEPGSSRLLAAQLTPGGPLEAVGYGDGRTYRHVLANDAVTTTTDAWPEPDPMHSCGRCRAGCRWRRSR